MNILFVTSSLSPSVLSCLVALSKQRAVRVRVVRTSRNANCPVAVPEECFEVRDAETGPAVVALAGGGFFEGIDCAFVSGWANGRIVSISKRLRKAGVPQVLLSDQPVKHSMRQTVGAFLLRSYVRQFRHGLVPGAAAKQLLVRYGLEPSRVALGLYSADDAAFQSACALRRELPCWPRRFLFDGQYIARKGLPYLLEEYRRYRASSPAPWDLWCVGKGPLERLITAPANNLGFKSASELPAIYAQAGCFVLASVQDHWPLVVHQACCAGLPLLLSRSCGNLEDLLVEGKNGYAFDARAPGGLCALMRRIESSPDLESFGDASRRVGSKYTVQSWVDKVLALARDATQLRSNDSGPPI